MPDRGRARLKDVAALAGVAESTASKVLNGVSTVSARPETQARILAAAEKLGYRPHAAARLLAGAPSRVLALLVPELTNPSYVALIRGASRQAQEHGYTVLLAEDSDDQQAGESFSDLVQTGRVDGLMIASARPSHRLVAWLDQHWVPHVFVNRSVPDSSCNVVMSFGRASTTALKHLVDLGHRSIGHVGGPRGIETADARAAAFGQFLRRHGLSDGAVVRVSFEEVGGAEGLEILLDTNPSLTAVYTSAFSQAVGALHVCHKRGIDVPGQLSVITADDLPLADYLYPPLTAVAMPLFELGSAAVDSLVNQLSGVPAANVAIRTPARLVVRGSTGPPQPTRERKVNDAVSQ
jgi:DNA-binding LacI/PurR family transcriptional regulator